MIEISENQLESVSTRIYLIGYASWFCWCEKFFENKLCVTISICHSEISVWVLGETSRKPLEFTIYVRKMNFFGRFSDQESAYMYCCMLHLQLQLEANQCNACASSKNCKVKHIEVCWNKPEIKYSNLPVIICYSHRFFVTSHSNNFLWSNQFCDILSHELGLQLDLCIWQVM